MPVLTVKEIPQRDGSFAKGYARKYKRVFRVVSDDEKDGPITIGYATGISIGDEYESFETGETDPLALCTDVDAVQTDESSLIWIVTARYENETAAPQQTPTQNQQPGSGGDPDDPTQWAPKLAWTYGEVQLAMRKALSPAGVPSVPVVNSAGYPFDPPPMQRHKYLILTHTRIEDYHSTFDQQDYAGAINAGAWNARAALTVALEDWQVEDIYIGQTKFYRHTRVFHFCPPALEDWYLRLLDAGTRTGDGDPILDPITRDPVTRDWPMDGAGTDLSPADIAAGNHVWLTFRDRPTADFGALNIEFI